MKSNLQIEYQSQYQSFIHKFLFRNLSDDGYEREGDEHDDDDDKPTKKVIIIIIALCIGLLILGVIVYVCRCIYLREKNKRIAKVRQQSEIAYQQQNIQLESVNIQAQDLMQCPICLMPIPCCMKITTQCNHTFHEACLNKWLQVDQVCPSCRAVLNK